MTGHYKRYQNFPEVKKTMNNSLRRKERFDKLNRTKTERKSNDLKNIKFRIKKIYKHYKKVNSI